MQWIQENVITRTISINILFVRCVGFLLFLMNNNVRRANECNKAKFSRELHIVNFLFMLFHLNLATQKLYRDVTTHFFLLQRSSCALIYIFSNFHFARDNINYLFRCVVFQFDFRHFVYFFCYF